MDSGFIVCIIVLENSKQSREDPMYEPNLYLLSLQVRKQFITLHCEQAQLKHFSPSYIGSNQMSRYKDIEQFDQWDYFRR